MNSHSTNQPIMIAHALGAINGHTYTNSEAAFRQSISDGFEYLEADLALTNDNKIIIYHHSKPKTDSEKSWRNKKAFQLNYDQHSNYRYVDKYPILKFDNFLSLIQESPSTKIILDIKTRNKKKVWLAIPPNKISYLNAFALKHFKKTN
jgi:glycerophosphoryl diester phosphodiesterase